MAAHRHAEGRSCSRLSPRFTAACRRAHVHSDSSLRAPPCAALQPRQRRQQRQRTQAARVARRLRPAPPRRPLPLASPPRSSSALCWRTTKSAASARTACAPSARRLNCLWASWRCGRWSMRRPARRRTSRQPTLSTLLGGTGGCRAGEAGGWTVRYAGGSRADVLQRWLPALPTSDPRRCTFASAGGVPCPTAACQLCDAL